MKCRAALKDADKLARMAKVEEARRIPLRKTTSPRKNVLLGVPISLLQLKSLEKHAMRKMVIETGERADGPYLAPKFVLCTLRLAISLVFTVLASSSVVKPRLSLSRTLGMLNEWQRLDTI